MAYCTSAQLLERAPYLAVSQLTPAEGAATQALKQAAAIASADATINRYLGSRYPVPLTTVPDCIVEASCTLAICQILRRSASMSDEYKMWEEEYSRLMKWLEAVAARKVDIYELADADTAGNLTTNYDDLRHTFTSDNLSGGRSLDGLTFRPARDA